MRALAVLLPFAAAMCATPAVAQRPSIAGCGTVAVPRADRANPARLEAGVECFDAAATIARGAADARRALIADLARPPVVTPPPVVVPPVTPTPAPSARPIIGINPAGFTYYSGVNIFANLILGSNSWLLAEPGKPNREMPADELDRGWLRSLPAGATASRILSQPVVPEGGLPVRCTWSGTGTVTAGNVRDVVQGNRSLSFRMTARWPAQENMWITIAATSPADPVRNVDCRAANVPADAVFDPAYVASLQPYAVLRFMDWSGANENAAATEATRHRIGDGSFHGRGGVPVEAYADLIRRVPGDPWFNIVWNADEAYVRAFATYVRDNVPADRTIYVETSNEVWNALFDVARQAQREGVAARLSDNPFQSQLHRYAQRSTEVMKIWTEVFAGQEQRLVRVLAMQHANPWTSEVVLSFGDTARFHDALATAPYFGYDIEGTDLDAIFGQIDRGIAQAMTLAARQQAVARRFGKRYLSYEAGQHVILGNNVPLNQRIQRDPRMGAAYARYIQEWAALTGEPLMQFVDFSPITQWGAWGLQEYLGQPVEQSPKAQAVRNAMGR